jgi:hypothetical protein
MRCFRKYYQCLTIQADFCVHHADASPACWNLCRKAILRLNIAVVARRIAGQILGGRQLDAILPDIVCLWPPVVVQQALLQLALKMCYIALFTEVLGRLVLTVWATTTLRGSSPSTRFVTLLISSVTNRYISQQCPYSCIISHITPR